ncbi:hypothetical protein L9F63_019969, partial [Diploptera punctata]
MDSATKFLPREKDKLLISLDWQEDKKPIWIANKLTSYNTGTFKDGIIWAHRLGEMARIGASVVLHEPNLDVNDGVTA